MQWHIMAMEENTQSTSNKKGMSPMMIGGIVLLVVVLIGAFMLMSRKGPASSSQTSNSPTLAPTQAAIQEGTKAEEKTEGAIKSFEVDGANFKFTPSTFTVNEGDTVKITFKNTQGFHNFSLDEFNAKSKTISAGQEDVLQFVASKKGTFQYYCAVGTHKAMGMVGTLTVN
ncbi:MAG: hypothetical protein EPO24_14770 [Bacteroidetes bacterium]|nr:MAG: hypothetical protein EPO24_14770 [Bacteroidota bacterium]